MPPKAPKSKASASTMDVTPLTLVPTLPSIPENKPIIITNFNAYTQFIRDDPDNSESLPILQKKTPTTTSVALPETDIAMTGVEETPTTSVPLPKTDESMTTDAEINMYGLKAPISIVKVRKAAWETLARSLIANAAKPATKTITTTGIYTSDSNSITIFIQSNQGGLTYTQVNKSFNLSELSSVFANAYEDEGENSDEEDDATNLDDSGLVDETKKSKKKGLTRENLNDRNVGMKNVDEAMLQIIFSLFLLSKINYVSEPNKWSIKAQDILLNFITVSSEKEYLDTGQLYAICEPTIEHNKKNEYTLPKIL